MERLKVTAISVASGILCNFLDCVGLINTRVKKVNERLEGVFAD